MNRIIGYVMVKDVTNEKHPEKLKAGNMLYYIHRAERYRLEIHGYTVIEWCARMGASDLVLEVANEFAGMECEEESKKKQKKKLTKNGMKKMKKTKKTKKMKKTKKTLTDTSIPMKGLRLSS